MGLPVSRNFSLLLPSSFCSSFGDLIAPKFRKGGRPSGTADVPGISRSDNFLAILHRHNFTCGDCDNCMRQLIWIARTFWCFAHSGIMPDRFVNSKTEFQTDPLPAVACVSPMRNSPPASPFRSARCATGNSGAARRTPRRRPISKSSPPIREVWRRLWAGARLSVRERLEASCRVCLTDSGNLIISAQQVEPQFGFFSAQS